VRGANAASERLEKGDAGRAVADVLLDVGAIGGREFAVEILREAFEHLTTGGICRTMGMALWFGILHTLFSPEAWR
jgi:hypothetical protein